MGEIPDYNTETEFRSFAGIADVRPWWGLGQTIPEDATPEELMKAAGIWFTVMQRKLYYITRKDENGNPQYAEIVDKCVNVRGDDGRALGIVSRPLPGKTAKYKLHQPKEVVQEFFDRLTPLGAKPVVAGSMYDSSYIWAQFKVPIESYVVDKRDTFAPYVFACTSFDGSKQTSFVCSPVIGVCQNTISQLFNEAVRSMKVSHKSRLNVNTVLDGMGLETAMDGATKRLRNLAAKTISDEAAQIAVVAWLYGPEVAKLASAKKVNREPFIQAANNARTRLVLELFCGAQPNSVMAGVDGTAYGLLMAMTGAYDHGMGLQKNNTNYDSARLERVWFQPTTQKLGTKAQALELCDAVAMSDSTPSHARLSSGRITNDPTLSRLFDSDFEGVEF